MSSTLCLNDAAFGPSVRGCRGDFDFTQKFERIFLSIIPASIFLALAIGRVAVLVQRRRVVHGVLFQYLKLGHIAVYAVIQCSLLILLATGTPGTVHGLSVAAASLVFAASLPSLALSYTEHSRALRPSTLLGCYMALTLLFDIAQARTAWLSITSAHQTVLARLFTSSVAAKVLILGLESVPKTRWIQWDAAEHSPEESSGFFGIGAYTWLNTLMFRGYRGVLDIDDLYPLDVRMAAKRMHAQLASKFSEQKRSNEPKFGLLKDLSRTLAGPFLAPAAPRVAMIAFSYSQPFLINSVLSYLEVPYDDRDQNVGYGLIGAAVLIYTGIAVSTGLYGYFSQRAAFMIRGCLSAAVYRKTTVAKLNAADDSAAITLMSADIERIIVGAQFVHQIWANTIEVALGCWLLEEKIGAAFVSPVVIIVICAGCLAAVLKFVGKSQKAWMERIQIRVGLTANAIANMKLYKISGMTGTVAELIQKLRVIEISVGKTYRWTIILSVALGFVPLCLSPVVTFAVASRSLGLTTLFTSLSYIILVTSPLTSMFQLFPLILGALACLQRIQVFLVAESRVDFRAFSHAGTLEDKGEKDTSSTEKTTIGNGMTFYIRDGHFGWATGKTTLNGINADIPDKKLTLVVGPVASGKSTFCKVLLGEVPESSGSVTAFFPPGGIGYCEQTPFLYNATLRENIIGHCIFDQAKYEAIVAATLLGIDIGLLPQGDKTKIGSNGIMLSGGQKQRVSVARALYLEAPIMIFDDVLSGLDTDTESELFRRVFGPDGIVRKRGATAVVCTHSVRHLPTADHIIALGADGTVVEEGTFDRLAHNNSYIQSLGVRSEIDEAKAPEEEEENGIVKVQTKQLESKAMEEALNDKSRQTGDWTIYSYWFRNVGLSPSMVLVMSGLMFGFAGNFSNVWLKYWAEDSFDAGTSFYVGIFGLLKGLQILGVLAACVITMITMITFAGARLHKRAITTVVTAPLRFFTMTDSGIVTNLFSQDMTLIDGELLFSMINVSLNVCDCIGGAAVIASATPYLAIGYPVLLGILYLIQGFYLRTSRQIRLLDLEAKSPLYTHFTDTIKGIATIRAFAWQDRDIEYNNALLDTSQRPAYLLAMIQKWLATVMLLLVDVLAVVVVAFATQLKTNAALTGAGLVTLLNFGNSISSVITNYTELETSIGAVSRLRTFTETVKPEDKPGEDTKPPESWPRGGRIDLQNVSASYGTEDGVEDDKVVGSPSALVLRDLTLTISPKQKVAICGRTGSGKSSLILLLMRLLDPLPSCEDKIEIDGLPLWRIDRATLRKRIIAIPQDAVFLPDGSSIKSNIDPFELATEEECAAAVELVQLTGFVTDRGGLQAGMSSDDLSAGQKQLFSLGRAIVRKRVRDRIVGGANVGGILLLDEVSSSVDQVTDRAMQDIIKGEFEQYTIVMVSHRLQMVMDFFDRVIVLDKGELVETGTPRDLVNTPGSRFGELWAMGHHGSSSSE